GDAYHQYGMLIGDVECLEYAAEAYQHALEFYTLRNQTMHYLKIQIVRGIVLKQLGRVKEAVVCWREAEHHFRQRGAPDIADTILMLMAGQIDSLPTSAHRPRSLPEDQIELLE
ncbi:MAG TPA: hypothetical protein VMT34_17065, partial [Aggregatilineales bacterium]|nr:hypothetical protein [Aggregatilineales bacterium]